MPRSCQTDFRASLRFVFAWARGVRARLRGTSAGPRRASARDHIACSGLRVASRGLRFASGRHAATRMRLRRKCRSLRRIRGGLRDGREPLSIGRRRVVFTCVRVRRDRDLVRFGRRVPSNGRGGLSRVFAGRRRSSVRRLRSRIRLRFASVSLRRTSRRLSSVCDSHWNVCYVKNAAPGSGLGAFAGLGQNSASPNDGDRIP
jgi:hypothetical protein